MPRRPSYFGPAIPKDRAWKEIERRRIFRRLFIKGKPGEEAARLAGYSKKYAVAHGNELAARALDSLKVQAEIQGVEEAGLVQWLKDQLNAKTPKWNRKTEKWDYFDDFTAQLAAWDRLRGIVEPEPPGEINVNIRRGVDAPPEENYEAWLERTTRERAERAGGQLLLAPSTGPTNGRHTGEGDSE